MGDALWLLVLFLPCSFLPPVNRVADGLSLVRRASVHSHLFVGTDVVPAGDRARCLQRRVFRMTASPRRAPFSALSLPSDCWRAASTSFTAACCCRSRALCAPRPPHEPDATLLPRPTCTYAVQVAWVAVQLRHNFEARTLLF